MSSNTSAALTGQVKWFSEEKGYGFITREDGCGDVFVHHTDVDMKGFRALKQGEEVQFEIGHGSKGPKAVRVRVVTK